MKPTIKYDPNGPSGNAFGIIGQAKKALKEAGIPENKIDLIVKEAMSGDYDHLIETFEKYLEFEIYYT